MDGGRGRQGRAAPGGAVTGPPAEVEATLLIRPGGPAPPGVTEAEIAALGRLGGARLEEGGTSVLRDVYLDTPDRHLRERRLALRLRSSGGEATLALKGEDRPLAGGGLERLEIEAPWSREALAEVRAALAWREVELPEPGAAGATPADGAGPRPPVSRSGGAHDPRHPGRGGAGPEQVLAAMGLRAVQRRDTTRRVRRIVPAGETEPAGELVVDRVGFRTPDGRELVHREVEVEGTGPGAHLLVAEVSSALLDRFPGRLRRWDHGKLATGEAVAALAGRGELEGPAPPGRGPTAEDYERIERLLARWEGGQGG